MGMLATAGLLLTALLQPALAETQHITLTFQYVNGTWVAVVPPAPPPTYTLSTKVVAAIFLFLVFFISLAGNSLIISTVGSSLTLRRLNYNLLLLQVGVCGVVETALNISLSTAYLLTQPWGLGGHVCRVNCFLMEVLPGVYTATLLLLMLDRTRALANATAGQHRKAHNTTTRLKVVVVFIWVLNISLCSPILVNLVEAWPFPKRYSCQVMSELAGYYGGVTAIVFYLLPWVISVILAILLYRLIQGEKKKEEKAARGHSQPTANKMTHTTAFLTSNQVWHELRNVLMVMILLMLYLVLWVPYIVMVKGDQVRQQWNPYKMEVYRNLTHSYYEESLPPEVQLDETGQPQQRALDEPEPEANLTLHTPGYWEVPEVPEGNIHETVFVWMRFLHCAIVPSVIFILNKDIRNKGTSLMCCCRMDRLNSTAPRPLSALLAQQSREQNRQKQMKKFKITNYHVPVLFATNQGLHLRVLDREVTVPPANSKQEPGLEGSWKVEPEFETELCDLKIEGVTTDGEKRPVPVLKEENAEEERIRIHDAEKVSVATDEGFHDESTHDTEPLVGKKVRKVQFKNTVLEFGSNNSSASTHKKSSRRSSEDHLGHHKKSSHDRHKGHRRKSHVEGGHHKKSQEEEHRKPGPEHDLELESFSVVDSGVVV